jgi:5-formyltetrahydrofolate cyclo-ligase
MMGHYLPRGVQLALAIYDLFKNPKVYSEACQGEPPSGMRPPIPIFSDIGIVFCPLVSLKERGARKGKEGGYRGRIRVGV